MTEDKPKDKPKELTLELLKDEIDKLKSQATRLGTDLRDCDRAVGRAAKKLDLIDVGELPVRLKELSDMAQTLIERNTVATEVGRALRLVSAEKRDRLYFHLIAILDKPLEWWSIHKNISMANWLSYLDTGRMPATVAEPEDDTEEESEHAEVTHLP